MASDLPTVAEVYAGQNVLTTGFTGFIGKLIVEKLLWECPDVNRIYVIIRSKKGCDISDRLQSIFEAPVFNRIRDYCPERLQKVIPIEGELSAENLALSKEDRLLLLNSNFVIHCAATVRFNQHIRDAVNINTRSTHILVELAKQMPNIKGFVYVSTAFSNCNQLNMTFEEKVYPPVGNWKDMIHLANTLDSSSLEILTKKIIGNFPNTYTFTKNLAEHVVNDAKCDIPVAICRPSSVASSSEEPLPHWVDYTFGPISIPFIYLTGFLRFRKFMLTKVNCILSDVIVRNIILAGWKRALDPPDTENDDVAVYNACTDNDWTITVQQYKHLSLKGVRQEFNDLSGFSITTGFPNFFLYGYHIIFGYALPAFLMDVIIALTSNKFRIFPLRLKTFNFINLMEHFTRYEFNFINDNFTHLPQKLKDPGERKRFDCTTRFNWQKEATGTMIFFTNNAFRDIAKRGKYRTMLRTFYWVDLAVLFLSYAFFGSIAFWILYNSFCSII